MPHDRYFALVRHVRAGGKVPGSTVEDILDATGHTHRELVAATLTSDHGNHLPGDPCECGGKLIVYSVHRKAGVITRYLWCNRCHTKPDRNKLREVVATT